MIRTRTFSGPPLAAASPSESHASPGSAAAPAAPAAPACSNRRRLRRKSTRRESSGAPTRGVSAQIVARLADERVGMRRIRFVLLTLAFVVALPATAGAQL